MDGNVVEAAHAAICPQKMRDAGKIARGDSILVSLHPVCPVISPVLPQKNNDFLKLFQKQSYGFIPAHNSLNVFRDASVVFAYLSPSEASHDAVTTIFRLEGAAKT